MAPNRSGLEFTLPSELNSLLPLAAATDPDAAGFGSTLKDSVSSLSGMNSPAEPVSSAGFVPELIDSAYDGVVMGMTSSRIQFLLEAQAVSSLRVDARPSSLRVDAPVRSLPTAQVVHGVSAGYAISGDVSGSHDPAKTSELERDLGEDSFIYPRRTSPKQIPTSREDKRLLSKPVYFPEWFDNVQTNSQKWLDYNDDKDDFDNLPESYLTPSCPVKIEPLSPIVPDSISLSKSLEYVLNTTRAKIAEPVLDA
jgi:hypothetical protein